MADQIVDDGAILTTELGTELQCTGVRYQENEDGTRYGHEYIFRTVADLTAEREAREKAEREAEEAQAILDAVPPINQPNEGVQ